MSPLWKFCFLLLFLNLTFFHGDQLLGYLTEIHAALAAALYADKHAKETKHWPPSFVSSLQQFITLS
jgi:hypothetical protein